jgi:hypothetical protein
MVALAFRSTSSGMSSTRPLVRRWSNTGARGRGAPSRAIVGHAARNDIGWSRRLPLRRHRVEPVLRAALGVASGVSRAKLAGGVIDGPCGDVEQSLGGAQGSTRVVMSGGTRWSLSCAQAGHHGSMGRFHGPVLGLTGRRRRRREKHELVGSIEFFEPVRSES